MTVDLPKSYKRRLAQAKRDGVAEVLGYIQEKYLAPEVARDSPEGKAMIALAKEISEHFRMGA